MIGILKTNVLYPVTMGYNPEATDGRSRLSTTAPYSALDSSSAYMVSTGAQSAQPVSVPVRALAARRATSFYNDYYNRTHINPSKVDVGNLLSTKLQDVEVWNAHLSNNLLSSIVATGADGITLTGVTEPPLTYAPLQSQVYTLNVSVVGPATIDALFSFTTALDSYTSKLSVSGLRILAWWPRPNWDTPIIERWEWLTDVMTSRNGKEQRRKLRAKPRRQYDYSLVIKNNAERRLFENLLFSWQSRLFGLPIWTDQEFTSVEIAQGTTTIPCTTFSRDYEEGGLVCLLRESDFEIGTISTVGTDHVTINSPLQSSWPVGTKVAPMRTARLTDKQSFVRQTDSILTMAVQFKLDAPDFRSPAIEAVAYQGYAVLEVKPNWREEITSEFQRVVEAIDFLTGRVLVDDLSGIPTIVNRYHFQAVSREAIHTLRAFIFARYGRLVPLWVPTFYEDIVVTRLISEASTAVFIEHQTYTRNISSSEQRRDIRILLTDGTIFYRRILTSTEEGSEERLVINSALGILVNPEDIAQVCFMSLSRLEADAVEVRWETDSIAEITTSFRTIRSDV